MKATLPFALIALTLVACSSKEPQKSTESSKAPEEKVQVAKKPELKPHEQRNKLRRSDVNTLLNAVYQYYIDNNQQMPGGISETPTEVCRTGGNCDGLIDLSVLIGKYVVEIPVDPMEKDPNQAGYSIVRNAEGRITVSSGEHAEGVKIEVTR